MPIVKKILKFANCLKHGNGMLLHLAFHNLLEYQYATSLHNYI